jgi:hypothetical protein
MYLWLVHLEDKLLDDFVSNLLSKHHYHYLYHQDAYAYSGQKCSAQSALFVHENWSKIGI